MNKILFICLLFVLNSFGETIIINEGKTYKIAEPNAIDDIQNHIENNKEKIAENLKKLGEEQKEKVTQYRPKQKDLTPAKKSRTFSPDMTYTLREDIVDANGKILYPKGFRFNPADFIRLEKDILIVNFENEEQKAWVQEKIDDANYMILIDKGNAFKLIEEYKRPLFYVDEAIALRFKIEHTPSVIRQIGNKIVVEEICLKDCI